MYTAEILAVILFLTGAQLALGSCDFGKGKDERFVAIVTAGLSMWNIWLAFVVGLSVSSAEAGIDASLNTQRRHAPIARQRFSAIYVLLSIYF